MHDVKCAMTAMVMRGLRVSAVLIGAVVAHMDAAGMEGISTPREVLSQFEDVTLSGDNGTTKCNAIWETDLNNPDGNLWFQSAVKVGDVIYCSAPAISGKEWTVRSFSANSGEEMWSGVVEVPEYMMSGLPHRTILARDDQGALLALRCMARDLSGKEAEGIIRITALNIEDAGVAFGSEYVDVPTEIDMLTENYADKSHMERVAYFSGDFNGGNFAVGAMIGWNDRGDDRFKQCLLEATVKDGVAEVKRTDLKVYDNEERVNMWLDFLVVDENCCVVTPNDGWPTICTGGSWDSISERMEDVAPTFTGDNPAGCRGFDTFMHNGHRLAVFAAHHNETDGVKFNIAEWPDRGDTPSFTSLSQCWAVPSNEFSHNAAFYPTNYRHILLAETPANGSRSAAEGDTRFYVYAPGCGLAAYELHTVSPTGVDTVTRAAAATLSLSDDGDWLLIDGGRGVATEGELYAGIYDLAGRMVMEARCAESRIYIGGLPKGHYIAAVGAETLKLAIR